MIEYIAEVAKDLDGKDGLEGDIFLYQLSMEVVFDLEMYEKCMDWAEYYIDDEDIDREDIKNFNHNIKLMNVEDITIDKAMELLNKYIERAYERKVGKFHYDLIRYTDDQKGRFIKGGFMVSRKTFYPTGK